MNLEDASKLDNDHLRMVLLKNGIDAGPVNELTRKLYLNKLARLAKEGPTKHAASGKEETEDQNVAPSDLPVKKTRASQSIGEFLERVPDCSSTPAVGVRSSPRKPTEQNKNHSNVGSPRKAPAQPRNDPPTPRKQQSQAVASVSTPSKLQVTQVEEPAPYHHIEESSLIEPASQRVNYENATHPAGEQISIQEPHLRTSTLVSSTLVNSMLPHATTLTASRIDSFSERDCDSPRQSYLSEYEREALRHRLSQAIKPRRPLETFNSTLTGLSSGSFSVDHSRVVSQVGRTEQILRLNDTELLQRTSYTPRTAPVKRGYKPTPLILLIGAILFLIGVYFCFSRMEKSRYNLNV